MNKRLKALLFTTLILLVAIAPFAKSRISQNPAFRPYEESAVEKGPFYYCFYVIPHDYLWVSLKVSEYNDCFGNYAITSGTNAWWYGAMANPSIFGGWAPLFAGWQYPKNLGDQMAGQIVYDHNIMWAANNIVSDFLWESDIQSPEASLVYYPKTYEGMISFYGFYLSSINEEVMGRISQSDYITYIDDSYSAKPLGIGGKARMLRWNYPNADDFNIHLLELKNNSGVNYDQFYFGLYMDADVDYSNAADNISYFDPDIGTAYIYHPTKSLGCVGITVFDTEQISVCELKIGYDETANFADPWVWDILTGDTMDYSYTKPYDARIVFGIGPYSFAAGATMEFFWATPNGYDVEKFKQNVKTARDTKENGWVIPNPPPEAPFLIVEAGNKEVNLSWSRNRNYIPKPLPAGTSGFYTEDTDPAPEYSEGSESALDPASLERDWDGYRVYRNLTGMGDIELGDYALVTQMDSTYVYNIYGVIPEAELDKSQWNETYYCEYTDRDPSIFNGFTYYYSVCAYDTGDRTKIPPIDPSYSSALANVQPATPAWIYETTPQTYRDKVEVVPNPYVEGQYTTWESDVRKVDFIHLPQNEDGSYTCTIKIYSFSGNKVRTIYHNDEDADESWTLNNDRGQNLAPGIYFYRVIPEDGSEEQTGKIMIIK